MKQQKWHYQTLNISLLGELIKEEYTIILDLIIQSSFFFLNSWVGTALMREIPHSLLIRQVMVKVIIWKNKQCDYIFTPD